MEKEHFIEIEATETMYSDIERENEMFENAEGSHLPGNQRMCEDNPAASQSIITYEDDYLHPTLSPNEIYFQPHFPM